MNRYIMFGRGICKKYLSSAEKFPEPKVEGNLVSRLVLFANTLPNMIYMYLFNYTEYYLEHWVNNTFCLSFSGIFFFLLFVTWQLLNTIGRFELFPSAGTVVVFIPPAPRRGREVYCFTTVRPSVRPRYFSSHFSQ